MCRSKREVETGCCACCEREEASERELQLSLGFAVSQNQKFETGVI